MFGEDRMGSVFTGSFLTVCILNTFFSSFVFLPLLGTPAAMGVRKSV